VGAPALHNEDAGTEACATRACAAARARALMAEGYRRACVRACVREKSGPSAFARRVPTTTFAAPAALTA